MVAGPDRSAYVTVHCNVLVVVSKLAFNTPCPLLTRGGTSLDGCRFACKATVSAKTELDVIDATDDINTMLKPNTLLRRRNLVNMFALPWVTDERTSRLLIDAP